MQTFLAAESDATCKRNALLSLATVEMSKAAEWLISVWDGVASMDDVLQMALIEVARMHPIVFVRALATLTQNPAAANGELLFYPILNAVGYG